jgi:predicted nicotinamide N-methyase
MVDDDDDDDGSVDSCEAYISFESTRNQSSRLEESISFSWPGIYEEYDIAVVQSSTVTGGHHDTTIKGKNLRKVVLSTLLEEDDLSPLFDGATWAGTRLWDAAIRAVQYLSGRLPDLDCCSNNAFFETNRTTTTSVLELGCGLGVPGMILHLLGCHVVLTDQPDILSQLEKNVAFNFGHVDDNDGRQRSRIQAMPLSWSRDNTNQLLVELGRETTGFDVVVNCDCVFEPLYVKSWHLLNETIDELLRVNPICLVLSSMERRGVADGIDTFLDEMRNLNHVGSVEKVWAEEERNIVDRCYSSEPSIAFYQIQYCNPLSVHVRLSDCGLVHL